ncbi:mannonate dehydratase [[Mycoplasma] testudinis]|uniref:mannonate dehydratase n=1 Tax=[Mycoplasma] testudinis TaxID=33924 RepID=UPI000A0107EA|nr:mannonate dehydratase [[Mycoplasma] testudinis]
MKLSFRWYGFDDKAKIEYIRQIPNVYSVVTAVYTVPVGEVWPEKDILKLKKAVEKTGLKFDVIESIPVHEDIKLRRGKYKEYIENYKENIRRCANAGVKVVCYNFMPVFDWLRTNLDYKLKDESSALAYFDKDFKKLDPTKLALPGWDASYKPTEIKELIDAYKKQGEKGLWESAKYFLNEIIPVAEKYNVLMAIHPDDPPWEVFGIPRIITGDKNLERYLKLYDSRNNGLTLCIGSLGCSARNDVVSLLRKYSAMDRIHFVHLRNIKIHPDGSFNESGHLSAEGSLDFYEAIKALVETNYQGYARPDHGRFIWGETGRPGYGLYDRALGVTYINGIYEAILKQKGLIKGHDPLHPTKKIKVVKSVLAKKGKK